MDTHPAPPPRRAPPNGRTPFHLPRVSRFLWLLPAIRSAWQALRAWLQGNTFAPLWLPEAWRHPLVGASASVLLAGGTTGLTLLLMDALPLFVLPGMLPMLGVVVVALTWGAAPSLLATLISIALLEALVLPHYFSVVHQEGLALLHAGLFVLLSLGVSLLASQSGWARRRAEALAGALSAAQTKSEAERQRLCSVLEVLPVGVFLADATGRLLETNPAGRAIWGEAAPLVYTTTEYSAYQGWWPGTGERLAPEDWALARALHQGETMLQEEIDIQTFDGQRKTILNHAVPVRDATGAIAGGVVAILDISERKRLEAALRQAEREAAARASELEAIFEALTDGLLVYDAQGRVLRANTAARQLLGFEVQPEFAALPWKERAIQYALLDGAGQPIPPENLTLSRLLRGEVLTSAQTADQRLETPDGRELSFSMTGRPLRDAEGAISGAVAIVRDVTERQRLERQVAEHAAQLEAIFESIADGVLVTDRQGRVLHMNQAGRTLLGLELDPRGWTLPELDGLAGFAGYTPTGQRLTGLEDPIPRILQGEVLTNKPSVDTIIRTRAGRETRINTTGAPIRDATGQLLGGVFVSRDVTEQRRLEQQTRATLDALLAMAEALVQAPDRAPADGKETTAEENPVARRLAELSRSVLGCQHVSMAAVAPGTAALTPITVVGLSPAQEQCWWASWDAHSRLGQHLPPEGVATLRAGEPVLLENTRSPLPIWLHLAPGRPALMVPMQVGETLVGILRVEWGATGEASKDQNRQALVRAVARLGALVLERERLLRERTEARANEMALRETQAQMETFLGMAGHELKNPLTSLKLALQLADRRLRRLVPHEPDGTSALVSFLDQLGLAEHQADRVERLVNELLDVSRVRAGKLELHPVWADLAAIVREAVEEQCQAIPDRSLLLHVPADLAVPVWADADRIGQVVTNYLTNALKYSPADCPVEVGLDVEEQQARVWVRDEGPGLPPEEQDRIWERFQRVQGIEVQSGTGVGLGLGLYICRTIIERHQGQVGVESAPGQGSTFWFTLPLGSQ